MSKQFYYYFFKIILIYIYFQGEAFPLDKVKGHKVNSKDPAVLQAMKVLRLAQLHKLRDLQTSINECIVAMQQATSNPKTDSTLGKVGY